MSETREADSGKLSLAKPKKLELKKTLDGGQVRQSFSHGRSKTVAVEIKKKRSIGRDASPDRTTRLRVRPPAAKEAASEETVAAAEPATIVDQAETISRSAGIVLRELTDDEKEARARALEGAKRADSEARQRAEVEATRRGAIDAADGTGIVAARGRLDTRWLKGAPARKRRTSASAHSIPEKRSHSSPGATPWAARIVSMSPGLINPE